MATTLKASNYVATKISHTHQTTHASKSQPGAHHTTTVNISAHCDCPAFVARGRCWHVENDMHVVGEALQETFRKRA